MKQDAEPVITKIMKMKSSLLVCVTLISLNVFGQGNIPIGTWRTHFNYQKATTLVKANEKIYCLTDQGLFYFDTQENSTSRLSKVDGLSDAGISAISYDAELDVLGIGYSNGNIDLVFTNEIFNITTIKKSSIVDNKSINHIAFLDGKIYLSTDFGVLVLNPKTGAIEDNYQNLGENGASLKIQQSIFDNNSIYLATSNGVLQASLNSNLNLQDFNNWERFNGSIVNGENINSMAAVNGKVYAATTSNIYSLSNNTWTDIGFNTTGESLEKIKSTDTQLLVVLESNIQSIANNGDISSLNLESGDFPKDVILGDTQTFWYADYNKGLSKSSSNTIERIVPKGIFSYNIARLEFVNDKMHVFPKSATSSNNPINNNLGYARFDEGQWINILPNELNDFDDISDAVALSDELLFVSSFGHGILDVTAGIVYNETNSPLANKDSTSLDLSVTSMEVDNSGNIWVSQLADSSLLKLSPDKTWKPYYVGSGSAKTPENIAIDDFGQIWMQPTSGNGFFGFNPETGSVRNFRSASGLPNETVTDLDIDRSGQVWVATEGGLAFLPFTFNAIDDNSVELLQPVFGNRLLFDGEKINAIEVDAGNRKWIATSEGLWLFEDDGDELIHNFNTENSPLPSNTIFDIKSDPITGEVFISTERGLVSFRSDAVAGNAFYQSVKIFPNPVAANYFGLIGITGLAQDANLKITDVSGQLVREINAAGGGASWDAADYNGVRVQTGIYLLFSSNREGTETYVGKIAVVN